MKHNKITSAKKGLSLALFCYFSKKPTTRKKTLIEVTLLH